jgi:hypothetical protein
MFTEYNYYFPASCTRRKQGGTPNALKTTHDTGGQDQNKIKKKYIFVE